MDEPRPILSVRDLSVEIRAETGTFRALDELSFDVMRAETLAVVGESGSGKTLTALSVLGLLPRQATIVGGTVSFQDRNLLTLKEKELCELRGNRISMVFQEPGTALNPVIPVGPQIAEVIRLHKGLGARTTREQVLALMEMVGIPDPPRRYRTYSHQLSGGTRQRVLIAMALACRPDLLLADEPTTALDPTVQAQIIDLLARLIRDLRMSVLLISHDLNVVAALADRVVVVHDGQAVEVGTTEEVLETPAHPHTRALLASRSSLRDSLPVTRLAAHRPSGPGGIEPVGCPFATSCPAREDRCATGNPPLVHLGGGRMVRCFVYNEVDDG